MKLLNCKYHLKTFNTFIYLASQNDSGERHFKTQGCSQSEQSETQQHVRRKLLYGDLNLKLKILHWKDLKWIAHEVTVVLSAALKLYILDGKNAFWADGIFHCSTSIGHWEKLLCHHIVFLTSGYPQRTEGSRFSSAALHFSSLPSSWP